MCLDTEKSRPSSSMHPSDEAPRWARVRKSEHAQWSGESSWLDNGNSQNVVNPNSSSSFYKTWGRKRSLHQKKKVRRAARGAPRTLIMWRPAPGGDRRVPARIPTRGSVGSTHGEVQVPPSHDLLTNRPSFCLGPGLVWFKSEPIQVSSEVWAWFLNLECFGLDWR